MIHWMVRTPKNAPFSPKEPPETKARKPGTGSPKVSLVGRQVQPPGHRKADGPAPQGQELRFLQSSGPKLPFTEGRGVWLTEAAQGSTTPITLPSGKPERLSSSSCRWRGSDKVASTCVSPLWASLGKWPVLPGSRGAGRVLKEQSKHRKAVSGAVACGGSLGTGADELLQGPAAGSGGQAQPCSVACARAVPGYFCAPRHS